jgi:hypothetical protein
MRDTGALQVRHTQNTLLFDCTVSTSLTAPTLVTRMLYRCMSLMALT